MKNSETLYITQEDLYRVGNSSSPQMLKIRAGEIVIIEVNGMLVSVGRGIEDEENLELSQELAEAMGAVVSCSRPIVDAKWLEKSRQVGTSGQTVKPKVYLACGISGSFQHLRQQNGSYFRLLIAMGLLSQQFCT